MPLSPPKPREKFHTRRITCEGYARLDGLWEVEAHMTDTKTYPIENRWRGAIEPGTPIHEMRLRVAFDETLTIREIEAATDNSPFEICPAITPKFTALIGLKMGSGFNRRVKEIMGGIHGCTHLVEMLAPVATVAFQTLAPGARRRHAELLGQPQPQPAQDREGVSFLDTCHAWARTSPVVKHFLPKHYVAAKED